MCCASTTTSRWCWARSPASTSTRARWRRPARTGVPLTLPYDSLVVAAGVGQSYFGHDEFAQWAPGMKTLDDALAQHARIFGAFEMAELEEDPEARKAWLTFVVVGGGPTGVEISGQIAELSRRALKQQLPHASTRADARVVLFDGGKEILATFGDRLSGKATQRARADGRRDPLPLDRHRSRRGRRRRQGAGRRRAADRREDGDLGGRSLSLAARAACSPTPPAPNATARAGSRCCPTARSPGTRRSSPSAT